MEQRILSSEGIVDGAAEVIVSAIKKASENGDAFNLALSGGKSPVPLFRALAEKVNTVNNVKLNVYQVDERYVDLNHDDSNQKMINECFLDLLDKKNKINHFFFNTDLPIDDAANLYNEMVDNIKLDMIQLGLGTDGHTASIFPDDKYTKIRYDRSVICTEEHNGYRRLTLSHKPLLASKQILLYAPGVYKRKIIEKIIDTANMDTLPASFLLHKHPNSILVNEK